MDRWSTSASRGANDEPTRQAILRVGSLFSGYAEADVEQRRHAIHAATEAIRALCLAAPKRTKTKPPLAPLAFRNTTTELTGVSDKRAELLGQLGIRTIGDLLRHYPARYEDRGRNAVLGNRYDGACRTEMGDELGDLANRRSERRSVGAHLLGNSRHAVLQARPRIDP